MNESKKIKLLRNKKSSATNDLKLGSSFYLN